MFIIFVRIVKDWPIGMDSQREARELVPSVQLDNNDELHNDLYPQSLARGGKRNR